MTQTLMQQPRASMLLAVLTLAINHGAFAQATFVVTSPADNGTGTLRAAIDDANRDPARTTIDFRIDSKAFGSGPWTIALNSELPEINTPVLIRGFSQPGTQAGASPLESKLMIGIDDSAVPKDSNNHGGILTFVRGAERSVVNGLSFTGSRSGAPAAALLLMADGVRANSNWIGVDVLGNVDRYSGTAIAALCANGVIIGGSKPGDGNLIGGSDQDAIALTGNDHLVRYNWVGFDRFGASSLSNMINGSGIRTGIIGYGPPPRLQAMYSAAVQQSFFGLRKATIADNRISATRFDAISLLGTPLKTSSNQILRNTIGRDLWASAGAIVDVGIRLSRGAENNTVADNLFGRANAGIVLGSALSAPFEYAGDGNELHRNLFYEIAQRAIALNADTHFSPLANDLLDADLGANGLQNKPEITVASVGGGVIGTLDSEPSKTYTIELFLSGACHPGGFDRAEFLLGEISASTDGNGHAEFSTLVTQQPLGGLDVGDVVTATATDIASGNTSELSACTTMKAAPAPKLTLTPMSSPIPAMDTGFLPAVLISGNGAQEPIGDVVFIATSATARFELGHAPIISGRAQLTAPAAGLLPHAGRFDIHAEYAGDGFNGSVQSTVQSIVVFRPPTALLDAGFSSPLRRDLSSMDREFYFTPMQTWRSLSPASAATYIDADRFNGSSVDRVFIEKSGQYLMIDSAGTTTPLNSAQINANTEILDLVHLDGDIRVDALVRNPGTGAYAIVLCAFLPDNCEKSSPLAVNVEFEYRLSGDFNGDGHADLVFRNRASGEIEVLLMDADKPLTRFSMMLNPGETLATSADINGDGFDDLIAIDAGASALRALLLRAGRPSGQALATLTAPTWETSGPVYFGKRGDSDYGVAQLLMRDGASGEVVVWRKPTITSGVLGATPQTLFFDPALTVERTR